MNLERSGAEPQPDGQPIFRDAVRHFWRTRLRQTKDQKQRGQADQGSRGAVTGGRQLDGFSERIFNLLINSGVDAEAIIVRSGRQLPGFFRPTKEWDILVVKEGHLLAAVELKSQVGSFGNNFNNRTEEALGNAVDLWTAFREGSFPLVPRPWLGYLFVLEDAPGSQSSVAVKSPHFEVRPEFIDSSYAKRYELLCRKLVLERHYDAACLILTDRNNAEAKHNYVEPAAELSGANFISELIRSASRPVG